MTFIERFNKQTGAIARLFDSIGFVWLWFGISLVLLALVLLLNPVKLGAYLWFMAKLTGAAALGFGFDSAFFRSSNPGKLDDALERSMAQTRRATLIAATIIAAGLIG